jgi:hypothetical protein
MIYWENFIFASMSLKKSQSRHRNGFVDGRNRGTNMTTVRKFFRCPVCNKLLTLVIGEEIHTDRWPLKIEGKHGNHSYIVFLDSQYSVTDVKKNPNEKPK